VDQLRSSGDYISDNFEIGGASVKGIQMGLALRSTVGIGIIGIGYRAGESVLPKNRYPNLIDELVNQSLINLRAYSLYLDDKETSSGSILFGGIDTEKFVGTLKVLPVQKDPQSQTFESFFVLMTSLSMTDQSGQTSAFTNADFPLLVVLDSGTSLTYLPTHLVDAIISETGAVDDTDNTGFIFVNCDLRTTRPNAFLTFGFGGSSGPVIHVPLSEIIRSLHNKYPESGFKNTCDLGIRASDTVYILGDTFLRSAYVVYDLDHNQIALAQTNFEATGSNIQEIPVSASGIPLLSGKANGVTQVPQSHFSTAKTSSSTRTRTPSDTLSSVSTLGGTIGAGGNTASPTPTQTQTQTQTPAATSATSKSGAVRTIPTLRESDLVVFSVPIWIALIAGVLVFCSVAASR
jgi:hypothetical protein